MNKKNESKQGTGPVLLVNINETTRVYDESNELRVILGREK